MTYNGKMNKTVLMSGAEYFNDGDAINVLMDSSVPVDLNKAVAEHQQIQQVLESAGVKVIKVDAPLECQDGVYAANWALVRGGKAVMSRLPNTRNPEEEYAIQYLKQQGLETLILPAEVARFSGQGDALPCGDTLFTHSPYRTTPEAHKYVKEWLGFSEMIELETKPARKYGFPVTNKITGLPDSPTYDIDLALAILKWPDEKQKGLIAYCPDVFKRGSRKLLASYDKFDKIKVSKKEALGAFALNLVSTGETVIMNSGAPVFKADMEAHGLKVVTLDLPELKKGGGSIRCTTLTLEN